MNQELWQAQRHTSAAVFQIGQHDPVVIDGDRLSQSLTDSDELQRVHQMVHAALAAHETADVLRSDQDPIVIHCFSGLPWKYALAAYDSVRAYEAQFVADEGVLRADHARAVTWAPPLVRNVNNWAMGNELFEIMHRTTR